MTKCCCEAVIRQEACVLSQRYIYVFIGRRIVSEPFPNACIAMYTHTHTHTHSAHRSADRAHNNMRWISWIHRHIWRET